MSKEFTVCQASLVATARREHYKVKANNIEEAVRLVDENEAELINVETSEDPVFWIRPELVDGVSTASTMVDGEIIKSNGMYVEDLRDYHLTKLHELEVDSFLDTIQDYYGNVEVNLKKPVFITTLQGEKIENAVVSSMEIDKNGFIKFHAKILNDKEDAIEICLSDMLPCYLPYISKCISNED